MEGFAKFQVALTVLLISTNYAQGSVIKFSASPSVLKTNLTSSASMRCSLEDTEVKGGQIGKRSITNTTDDIFHISAIYITRGNGDDVASVSPFDAPMAYVDLDNLEVKGDVTGASSQGYLQLSWMNPSGMAMGEYKCEVNTVTDHHHSVLFTSTLEMTEVEPTINDVIVELKKQEAENRDLRKQQTDMKQQQTDMKQQQTDMEQQQTTMKECASRRVGFMAVISHAFTVAQDQPVVFDKVIYSIGGSYNQTTGLFNCLEPGLYSFSLHTLSREWDVSCLNLELNSKIITTLYSWGNGGSVETGAASAFLHLQKNDIVQVKTCRTTVFFEKNTGISQGNAFVGHMVQSDCLV